MRSIISMIAVVVCTVSAEAAAPFHPVSTSSPGRYLVILKPNVQPASSSALSVPGRVVHVYSTVLNGFSVQTTEAAVMTLTSNPDVDSIWEVPIVRPTETQIGAPTGLDRMDQRALPLDRTFSYAQPSSPVTIYIADTGVDPRLRFENRLVTSINFTSDANGNVDPSDYTDGGVPLNDVWHGTSTAVIAGGVDYGVARTAKLVNVRVLRPNTGTWDDIVAGIQWITEQANARPSEHHVANASFAGLGYYAPAETVLRNSIAAGVAWIFAAGNSNADACDYFPAKLGRQISGAVTVGSFDPENDEVLSDSNQGRCVEIFAPSRVAWGTQPETDGTVAGGTSAAAPHVAGAFAVRWAESPGSSAAEVEGIIKGTATTGALRGLISTSPDLMLYLAPPRRRPSG